MKARKHVRARGRKSLSKYFHKYKPGDKVALVLDLSEAKGRFAKQFHGITGTIEKQQGHAYIVKFLNGKVIKRIITIPAHLKPIKHKKTERKND
ncbi:MAG: 50S ribosomal protein L21e [Candidatus Pacearchaeota archaeon]